MQDDELHEQSKKLFNQGLARIHTDYSFSRKGAKKDFSNGWWTLINTEKKQGHELHEQDAGTTEGTDPHGF